LGPGGAEWAYNNCGDGSALKTRTNDKGEAEEKAKSCARVSALKKDKGQKDKKEKPCSWLVIVDGKRRVRGS
jgi:hypothetical protein